MVVQENNTLLVNPISDQTEETLLPIIERHVAVKSDGWSAYYKLKMKPGTKPHLSSYLFL